MKKKKEMSRNTNFLGRMWASLMGKRKGPKSGLEWTQVRMEGEKGELQGAITWRSLLCAV